jgi:hypothetical protein
MLQHFGDEIWTTGGPIAEVAGFKYPTRMVLIRLSDGSVFVWSPTALSDELHAAADALGPVRHIVAPNTLHHLFVREWHQAYPAAKIYGAPGLRKRRPDIVFDDDLNDLLAWIGQATSTKWIGQATSTKLSSGETGSLRK